MASLKAKYFNYISLSKFTQVLRLQKLGNGVKFTDLATSWKLFSPGPWFFAPVFLPRLAAWPPLPHSFPQFSSSCTFSFSQLFALSQFSCPHIFLSWQQRGCGWCQTERPRWAFDLSCPLFFPLCCRGEMYQFFQKIFWHRWSFLQEFSYPATSSPFCLRTWPTVRVMAVVWKIIDVQKNVNFTGECY